MQNHTGGIFTDITYPTKHFCELCTTLISVSGTPVSSVRHAYPYREVLSDIYDTHTRTRTFCKFCTPGLQYPGYGCNIFIPVRNLCEFGIPVPQYPELLLVMYDIHTRTRNFCELCTPVPQYPNFREFCTASTPVPGIHRPSRR